MGTQRTCNGCIKGKERQTENRQKILNHNDYQVLKSQDVPGIALGILCMFHLPSRCNKLAITSRVFETFQRHKPKLQLAAHCLVLSFLPWGHQRPAQNPCWRRHPTLRGCWVNWHKTILPAVKNTCAGPACKVDELGVARMFDLTVNSHASKPIAI